MMALALAVLLAQEEIRALPGEPFERLGGTVRASLAALDAGTDGWGAEVRSSAAQDQLRRLGSALEGAEAFVEPEELCSDAFSWQAPGELGLVRNAPFQVRRPRPGSKPVEGQDLTGWLTHLGWIGGGFRDIQVHWKTVGTSEDPTEPAPGASEPERFSTRVLARLTAQARGGLLQADAELDCRWRSDPRSVPSGGPRLERIEVKAFEEVLRPGPRPFLADCTASWLAGAPAWERQLLPGLPYWRARLDTRLGLPLLGHAAGLALGDVDGDGREDVYLCQPGGLPNKLLVQRADGTVRDASEEAGVDFLDFSRSALLLDFDGDGDRDLAVTVVDRLLFLSNDGHGRFWLQAVLPASEATSMAAADVDLDGDLDLYVCAYASPYDHGAPPAPYHDARNGSPNTLFENQGDWIFIDATEARGLDHNNDRFSFAASWEDYDLDGDPDLYVANDFGRNNLYRNDDGRFVDVALAAGVEDVSAGMGVTWGDYDGDGRFDLYVSNMFSSAGNRIAFQRRFHEGSEPKVRALYQRHARGNTLFRNAGDGSFVDVTQAAGVGPGRWAWGALFCDLDDDGWQDLLVPNGFVTEDLEDDL